MGSKRRQFMTLLDYAPKVECSIHTFVISPSECTIQAFIKNNYSPFNCLFVKVYFANCITPMCFSDDSAVRICLQCRKGRLDPWFGKIPRRVWQPALVFLLGKPHGLETCGLQSKGSQRDRHE